MTRKSTEPEGLVRCICPSPAPGPVCQVPHDRWVVANVPADQPYPCRCRPGRCDINWCECAGRTDLHAVPDHCCARQYTPRRVAIAKHGGSYRTCWCAGDIDRHKDQVAPVTGLIDPDADPGDADEDDEEDQ